MLATGLLIVGLGLVLMALAERPVQRLPLSAALLYLLAGWLAARAFGLLAGVNPADWAPLLELLTEWALLITLFAIGLRLGAPDSAAYNPRAWSVAVRLASSAMVLTIALATPAAHYLLGLPWAAALLLATLLAPTDPVLASQVQVRSPGDGDAVRQALTAEGGLNDGTAWPVVTLALGLVGLRDLGPGLSQWLLHDLLRGVGGGVLLGWLLGRVIGLAVHGRLRRKATLGWDELLYVGTIALVYGAASLLQVSTFLAVFVAGVALLRGPRVLEGAMPRSGMPHLSGRLVAFGARLERLVEVLLVIFIGAALAWVGWRWQLGAFALALLVVARPLAVLAVLRRSDMPPGQRRMVAWLGIRGVGSIYYLNLALAQGVRGSMESPIVSAVLVCVAASIVLHGVSSTPLMQWYQKRQTRRP